MPQELLCMQTAEKTAIPIFVCVWYVFLQHALEGLVEPSCQAISLWSVRWYHGCWDVQLVLEELYQLGGKTGSPDYQNFIWYHLEKSCTSTCTTVGDVKESFRKLCSIVTHNQDILTMILLFMWLSLWNRTESTGSGSYRPWSDLGAGMFSGMWDI